jgi:hypothetical protein
VSGSPHISPRAQDSRSLTSNPVTFSQHSLHPPRAPGKLSCSRNLVSFPSLWPGARIVGDLAVEIDRGEIGTKLAARVQVRLYADPRQPKTGIEVALAGRKAPSGVTFAGERAPFRLVEVEWICAPTDGVCDAREPLGATTALSSC